MITLTITSEQAFVFAKESESFLKYFMANAEIKMMKDPYLEIIARNKPTDQKINAIKEVRSLAIDQGDKDRGSLKGAKDYVCDNWDKI